MSPFAQSLRQAQISILKIHAVFLRFKFSPFLTLDKIEHFARGSNERRSPFTIVCSPLTERNEAAASSGFSPEKKGFRACGRSRFVDYRPRPSRPGEAVASAMLGLQPARRRGLPLPVLAAGRLIARHPGLWSSDNPRYVIAKAKNRAIPPRGRRTVTVFAGSYITLSHYPTSTSPKPPTTHP